MSGDKRKAYGLEGDISMVSLAGLEDDITACYEMAEPVPPWKRERNALLFAILEQAWDDLLASEGPEPQKHCCCATAKRPPGYLCMSCRPRKTIAGQALDWFRDGCLVPFGPSDRMVSLLDLLELPQRAETYVKACARYASVASHWARSEALVVDQHA